MERYGIGKTDIGRVRQNNEDSFFVRNEPLGKLHNLFIVADGMGGHQAGEVASEAAIQHFCAFIEADESGNVYTETLLADAARHANNKVYNLSLAEESTHGMGTTLSACCCDDKNLYFAHVGDSRIYMFSGGQLKQLTVDHTYVEEMVRQGLMTEEESVNNPNRHLLTRALGTDFDVPVDAGVVPLADGDMILLCSDGLTTMLENDEIATILYGADTNEAKTEKLVAQALQNGGLDNVTVILL